MADLTLTIPLPVLVSNQGFKVEYRLQGLPTWTLWGVEGNSPFTITGLVEGFTYEVQFTFLSSLSPQIACDPYIQTYIIPEEIPCIEATGELTQVGDIWTLSITVTYPSPYAAPCGGYELIWGTTTLNTVQYTNLPVPLQFPATNDTYYVAIYALDCNGNRVKCFEDYIDPTSSPCVHATLVSATIIKTNGKYYLSLTIIPSSPLSSSYDISFSQTNAVTSGVPQTGGGGTYTSALTNPETFIIPISPNINVGYENSERKIIYKGGISDRCDYTTPFTAEYTL